MTTTKNNLSNINKIDDQFLFEFLRFEIIITECGRMTSHI